MVYLKIHNCFWAEAAALLDFTARAVWFFPMEDL